MSLPSSHFSKPTKLFEILSWYGSLNFTFSFSFLGSNLSTSNTLFLVYWQPHPKFLNHQTGISITVNSFEMLAIKHIWSLSSIHKDEINQTVSFPVMRVPHVLVFQWGNIGLLTSRYFDVANFTNPTPLSLLVSSKLVNFKLVSGLQVYFLLNFVQKFPNNIVYDTLRTDRTPASALPRNCPHYHHCRLSWGCKFRAEILL